MSKLSALDDLDILSSDASSSDTSKVKVSGTSGSAIELTVVCKFSCAQINISNTSTAPKPSA